MGEADRLRLARQALAVACPWCSVRAGAECLTVQGKPMLQPHEQRQARWGTLTRPRRQ